MEGIRFCGTKSMLPAEPALSSLPIAPSVPYSCLRLPQRFRERTHHTINESVVRLPDTGYKAWKIRLNHLTMTCHLPHLTFSHYIEDVDEKAP